MDVLEGHAGEPVDADEDVRRRFLATGQFEVAAARRAGADEDRVVLLREDGLQAVGLRGEVLRQAELAVVAYFPVTS